MLRSFVLAAALAVALPAAGALADDARLTVTGEGTAAAAPDMALATLGVVSQAGTAAEALAQNSASTHAVIAAAKEQGIEARDIQTSNFSVGPRYENSSTAPYGSKIAGYEVTNEVGVRLRNVAELGTLLDAAIEAGANTVNGVSFGFIDNQAVTDEARRNAVADAMRKAKLYADAAGVTLGPIVSFEETQRGGGPRPMAAMREMSMASVPIETGESSVEAAVTITFELGE